MRRFSEFIALCEQLAQVGKQAAGLSQRLDPRAEVDVISLATDHERRD